ncbi:uncharacterized protein LOC144174347 [Haemaphysalis longicornis]
MNLKALKKPQLLELAKELRLDVTDALRKPELIEAILAVGADDDELSECIELINDRETDKRQAAEAERQREEREEKKREQEQEERKRQHELEMKRLDVEASRPRRQSGSSVQSAATERPTLRMCDLMRPYKVGEDIGLFLVNFERTCERAQFSRDSWPQKLLTLLPGEASDVMARLPKEEAEDYQKVKSSLLRKYRLSAEAFRQKFREAEKARGESYSEFAYKLKANMEEWLKEAEAFGEHDKVVECFGLEQFYRRLPENLRLWVQDRPGVKTVDQAAQLADEFVARRGAQGPKDGHKEFRPRLDKSGPKGRAPQVDGGARKVVVGDRETGHDNETRAADAEEQRRKKAYEARRQAACYNCGETGHFAASCKKGKLVFHVLDPDEDSRQLLEPYVRELAVNGKPCRVLRDSAATMDVVHPSYVEPHQFTGDCAWIKQAVEAQGVCLPIARITIDGPFGKLETEAAVSPSLPAQYPYLFSNRSDQLLRERGLVFGEGIVFALTRSKARELGAKVAVESRKDSRKEEVGKLAETSTDVASERGQSASLQVQIAGVEQQQRPTETHDSPAEIFVAPTSESLERLLHVDSKALGAEQKKDHTLEKLLDNVTEGVAKKNVRFQTREEILYRKYRDRRGVEFDQLVVPQVYRQDLLRLAHGNSWSGHLGIRKTKDRLLQEYYWPGCFRDVENFVRTCDVCQRVGKPGDKTKAPMKLVPVITEPFRRLVIDTVGPLPATTSGYRHILTVLCPATKFPEAVPLKELSSVEIVNALLSVFARVGFPAEIQSDQGTVFTSALTTTFLEKCGVKLIHSSVYHPQSNSVEKLHSVMKRVLRAMCYERKTDWELCLPAAMFALRTAPHETTGFTPAELVYGRSLRSPLRILRESWEGRGEDPMVVEYVLSLMDRLHRAQQLAGTAMSTAQKKSKPYYDKGARARQFEVGDQVMILRPSQRHKLEVQWEGPAKILQKLSETNYVVSVPGKRKLQQVYHSNLLKPYRQREAVVQMLVNIPEEIPPDIPELGPLTHDSTSSLVNDLVTKAELEPDQKRELEALLEEFSDRFSDKPGRTSLLTHDIELTSSQPVRSKAYRVSPRQREILETEIQKMLALDVIEACESDYTSPLILVEVPGKDPRPCVDYRKLNLITRDQTYPIPNIEERIEKVSSACFISTFDLVRGYWQVPLTKEASRYAAFISPMGTFRPKVLSFGLKNAPYCFSSLMDKVLRGFDDFALPYLDDVAIYSASWPEHLEHLRSVLSRLREAGLTIKAPKCQMARAEVTYLGHVIGRGHRRPSEVKVAAIRDFPQPRTKTDIRSFLGITGYYQRYIPRYSELASPLTDALRKNEPLTVAWDEAKEQAFADLKNALTSHPVLNSPDYSEPFVVQCDASDRGMGVVLCQKADCNEEHPVLYASRKLTIREEAYSASEKECACLVWAVQKLACYLAGSKFIVETDHCPLTWLHTMSSKNGRLLRWSLALQQYTFEVRYKKGKLNGNADGLSRSP